MEEPMTDRDRSSTAESGRTVPDFFIVGQPKCGTTALYEMLKLHPELFMPTHKEPNYFIKDAHYNNTPKSLEEYLGLFDDAIPGQHAGEASVLYMSSTTPAPEIARLQPGARIIAFLREPSSLLRSYHLEMLEKRVETEKSLRRALAAEPRRRAAYAAWSGEGVEERPMLFYSNHVRYVEQLSRFYDHFPAEQILVLLYEDFRADNAGVLKQILHFLDIEHRPLEATKANPTVNVRSPRLNRFIHSLEMGRGPVSGAVKRAVKTIAPARLRRRTLDGVKQRVVYTRSAQADEALMAELRELYLPEVEALDAYFDGRFELLTRWGYG
jgi:hypothetical protein